MLYEYRSKHLYLVWFHISKTTSQHGLFEHTHDTPLLIHTRPYHAIHKQIRHSPVEGRLQVVGQPGPTTVANLVEGQAQDDGAKAVVMVVTGW